MSQAMNNFIGTKALKARKMNKAEYCEYRGWDLPINEDPKEKGYLVEYEDCTPNHPNHTGYISWSPKATFEAAYVDLGEIAHHAPHEQRMIGELSLLNVGIDKLQTFTNSDMFNKLEFQDRSLLSQQLMEMKWYQMTLAKRVKRLIH